MKFQEQHIERNVRHFHTRVYEGDILDRQHFVVPIKTRGRSYGAISRAFVKRYPNCALPVLQHLEVSEPFILAKEPLKTVTFVAYWDDTGAYTANNMSVCASRSILKLSKWWLEYHGPGWEEWTISLPLFKGAEGSVRCLAEIEHEIEQASGIVRGNIFLQEEPEVEIVVNTKGKVPGMA